MPTSRYLTLMESPFIMGVTETSPIGVKQPDALEAERKMAEAMVELARAQEVSL